MRVCRLSSCVASSMALIGANAPPQPRADGPGDFAWDADRFAAGGQDLEECALTQQEIDDAAQASSRCSQLSSTSSSCEDRRVSASVFEGSIGGFLDCQHGGEPMRDERRVGHLREFYEPHTVAIPL
jgi:hypothetical protein